MRSLLAAAFVALLPASSAADEPPAVPPANTMLKGLRYSIKPGFTYQKTEQQFMPPITQDVSFAVSNHLGYGFAVGPIVLSPGASVPVYFFDSGNDYTPGQHSPGATLAILGEVEVHLPFKYGSVFGVVGAGGAFAFSSNQQGGIFRGGGGLMAYPVSWLGLGMQATYLMLSQAARGPNASMEALELVWPIELRL